MFIISMIILTVVVIALAYTYGHLIAYLMKRLQLHWLPAALIICLFMGLMSGLIFIIYHLFMAETINAGTLLGMLFGITLILATIRTFPDK